MPSGDGMGPSGWGPMTGRRRGYCVGYNTPGFVSPRPGMGRGWGPAYGPGVAPVPVPVYAPVRNPKKSATIWSNAPSSLSANLRTLRGA